MPTSTSPLTVEICTKSQNRRGRTSSTSAAARPRWKKKEELAVFPCRTDRTPSSLMLSSRFSRSPSSRTSAPGSSSSTMVTSPLTICTSTPLRGWEGKAVPSTRRTRLFSQKKPPRSRL